MQILPQAPGGVKRQLKTFPDGFGILFFMSSKQGRELVKSHFGECLAASFSEAVTAAAAESLVPHR